MGLGYTHVLAPKNLGPELQVIKVPPERNAGQIHWRDPCLVADAVTPKDTVLVGESVIESGIALIGGVKHLRIRNEVVGRELRAAGVRQRKVGREFLHDGVEPRRRDLIIGERRPYVA